jgi:hypothetical protein
VNLQAAKLINRAADLTGSYGHARRSPEQMDAEALAKLTVELINQELDLFARFCYRANDHGRFVHLLATGQLKNGIWTPWGSSGKSALTRSERDSLRAWLSQMEQFRQRPVWLYNPQNRRWYVDVRRYPTLNDALSWLSQHPLTARDWLNLTI